MYRTHCRQCGVRIAGGERHYTLTVPFGPVIGVEHEKCPSSAHPEHCVCRGRGTVEAGPAGATYSVPCPRLRCLDCGVALPEGRAYRCDTCDPLSAP